MCADGKGRPLPNEALSANFLIPAAHSVSQPVRHMFLLVFDTTPRLHPRLDLTPPDLIKSAFFGLGRLPNTSYYQGWPRESPSSGAGTGTCQISRPGPGPGSGPKP